LGNKVVQASRSATARDQEVHEERMMEAQVGGGRSPQRKTPLKSNDQFAHPRSCDLPNKKICKSFKQEMTPHVMTID